MIHSAAQYPLTKNCPTLLTEDLNPQKAFSGQGQLSQVSPCDGKITLELHLTKRHPTQGLATDECLRLAVMSAYGPKHKLTQVSMTAVLLFHQFQHY